MAFHWKINGTFIKKTICSRPSFVDNYCSLLAFLEVSYNFLSHCCGSEPWNAMWLPEYEVDMRYINIWTEVPWASAFCQYTPRDFCSPGSRMRSHEKQCRETQLRQQNYSQPPALLCQKQRNTRLLLWALERLGLLVTAAKSWLIHDTCKLTKKISTTKFKS